MNTDTDLNWHADDDLLAAYVAGRTRPPVTASVEMHLMGCGHCRGVLAPLVDPAPLRGVWDRVADELQAPPRTRTERLAARLGLTDRDALLVAAAPALRGSWLLGLLLCLLFAVIGGDPGGARGSLLFLACAAGAGGRGRVRLRAGRATRCGRSPWPRRTRRCGCCCSAPSRWSSWPCRSPSSPRRCCPARPGWRWPGCCRACACAAFTLALSTWIPVSRAAGRGLRVLDRARSIVAAGPVPGRRWRLAAPLLPAYLVVARAGVSRLLDALRPAVLPGEELVNNPTINLDAGDPPLRLGHRPGRPRPRPVPRHHRAARAERRRQDHPAADPGHRAGADAPAAAGSSAGTPTTRSQRTEIRRRLGYLPAGERLPARVHRVPVRRLRGCAQGVDRARRAARARYAGCSSWSGSPTWPRKRMRTLSGGQRRRAALAQALIGHPGAAGPRRADHRPRPRAAGVPARRTLRAPGTGPRCCWPRTRPRTSRPCASGSSCSTAAGCCGTARSPTWSRPPPARCGWPTSEEPAALSSWRTGTGRYRHVGARPAARSGDSPSRASRTPTCCSAPSRPRPRRR